MKVACGAARDWGRAVTEASRKDQIALALKQRDEDKNQETQRDPLRDKLLPVIEVPLDLPVLNHRSFRIAAQLNEHPERELVNAEPDSPRAQAIIADLVMGVHRNVAELKESLQVEGQTDAAMITRGGVLLNGNTRCVLLRRLRESGELLRPAMLRVAVLPHDYTNKNELELELVLQQQKDLKDEYRLINELVMIRRLRDEGFSEKDIAQRQRRRRSGKGSGEDQVKDRLKVLAMMEVMRTLSEPPLRLTDFDDVRDKFEVWYELLGQYHALEEQGRDAADAHLRRWLIAYFSGVNSVHNLRYAKDDWIEGGVISSLDADMRAVVEQHQEVEPEGQPEQEEPSGLDLLGGRDDGAAASPPQVHALFNAVVAAKRLGEGGVLRTPTGVEIDAGEFITSVGGAVRKALANRRKEAGGANALDEPFENLADARASLAASRDQLGELVDDAAFAPRRKGVTELATEVADLATKIVAMLRGDQRK